jgi:glycosyltransferase involved in cell wall biosynthesis
MKKMGAGRLQNLRHLFCGLGRLCKLLRTEHPDVVLTFTRYANWIGPFAAKIAKVKVCITSQRNSWREAGFLFYLVDRIIANSRFVQCMTTVSEQTREFCINTEGMNPEKLITIHNGVSLESFSKNNGQTERIQILNSIGVTEDIFRVVTVARFFEQKGHCFLVDAVTLIDRELPVNVRFVFVGEGPLLEEIKKRCIAQNVEYRFIFAGVRNDVPEILSVANLFVLPSLHEGMPNVVLEAMAASVPVVATAVDGALEIIEHGHDGYLVEPANSQELGRRILELVQDEQLRNSFSRHGRDKIVASFSQEKITDHYERLFEDCLNGSVRR